MFSLVLAGLRTINQILTAGIAITAFSLLLYALSFNLADRVVRTFTVILGCVVIVFMGDALGSTAESAYWMEFWLRMQWVGIVFLPPAYLHFSDALLATTGRPSRGRRRLAIRLSYLCSFIFLLALPFSMLVGPLLQNEPPAPHLQRTWLTWMFTLYYIVLMVLSWVNFWRALQRSVTSTSRRRMRYLLAGALAPALGSYPYLLFGSGFASRAPLAFWLVVLVGNLMMFVLLVIMAYAVAFFGVPWPDRVVKRRLLKWIMRGPVTAILVLAVTTIIRRSGQRFGFETGVIIPVAMAITILVSEHVITLAAPIWERRLFYGRERADWELLESLEERLLSLNDLHQFLESLLTAACDRLQVSKAFTASFGTQGTELLVQVGGENPLPEEGLSADLLNRVRDNGFDQGILTWGGYWLIPLFDQDADEPDLLGLFGIQQQPGQLLEEDQLEALLILSGRAALALRDRRRQQQVFSSLEALSPQMEMIQRLRAAARYDRSEILSAPSLDLDGDGFSQWVKDALTHYWGGPKLTQSPLLKLEVVQQEMAEHDENPINALRAVLRRAVDQVRPEGERRFTAEWILYNILEMKFMEGHKVREVAMRLAMSEADLYRKQRVAIEAVANVIVEMEKQARQGAAVAVEGSSEKVVQAQAR